MHTGDRGEGDMGYTMLHVHVACCAPVRVILQLVCRASDGVDSWTRKRDITLLTHTHTHTQDLVKSSADMDHTRNPTYYVQHGAVHTLYASPRTLLLVPACTPAYVIRSSCHCHSSSSSCRCCSSCSSAPRPRSSSRNHSVAPAPRPRRSLLVCHAAYSCCHQPHACRERCRVRVGSCTAAAERQRH